MSRRQAGSPRPLAGRVLVGAALALAAILGLRFMLADDGYPAILGRRGELVQVQAEVQAVHRENQDLRQRILGLEQQSYPVEKLAREELDFAAPGELIYLFPRALPAPREGAPGPWVGPPEAGE